MTDSRRSILVTGATGFLGRQVLSALAAYGEQHHIIAACRDPRALAPGFRGEIRVGDLRDPAYRSSVLAGVDVVCHAGTWGAFWGHAEQERAFFYEPALDLLEQCARRGVGRFLLASTVAIAPGDRGHRAIDDAATPRRTNFWPHVDRLIDLDERMQELATPRTTFVNMRLGHFVGAGNRLGLVPALVPRLRTRLVPWLANGAAKMPLVADTDLGRAFALAATAPALGPYESLNIVGPECPSLREVIDFIAVESGSPRPLLSVPYAAGYAFAWLMEALTPMLPGSSPFLTRSLVHVAESRGCTGDRAREKIGYVPQKSWRTAARDAIAELSQRNYPWPRLAQGAE